MPLTATIKIGDKPVMVRELILSEINELMNAPSRPIVDAIAHLLSMCTDVKPDDLMPYAPSDIKPMIDKLLELNKDFFVLAETLDMPEISAELRKIISRISMLAFLPLSSEGTE